MWEWITMQNREEALTTRPRLTAKHALPMMPLPTMGLVSFYEEKERALFPTGAQRRWLLSAWRVPLSRRRRKSTAKEVPRHPPQKAHQTRFTQAPKICPSHPLFPGFPVASLAKSLSARRGLRELKTEKPEGKKNLHAQFR